MWKHRRGAYDIETINSARRLGDDDEMAQVLERFIWKVSPVLVLKTAAAAENLTNRQGLIYHVSHC